MSPSEPVFFSKEDSYAIHFPHNDALVVTAYIGCCKVSKIFVDGGSSVNILYGHIVDRMEDTLELAQKFIIPRNQSLFFMDLMRTRHVSLALSNS